MEGKLLSRIVHLIGIAYLQSCAADKLAPDYVPAHHGVHGQFAHTEETYTPTTDYQEYYNYNQGNYNYAQSPTAALPYGASFNHAFGFNQDLGSARQETDAQTVSLVTGAINAVFTGVVGLAVGESNRLTCNKVNEILGITSLGDTTDDAINPSTGNYVLASNAIADDTNACTPPTGITLTNTAGVALANTAAATALSLENFNTFRKQVATAISTLDKKIDEILNKATLTC